ncbi:MAG: hypothetical protein KJ063_02845 [Anaerolineae bacterium]|nr:hypothetical protein [Anaerolineae bacterium]
MSDETIMKVEVKEELARDIRTYAPWMLIGGGVILLALNLFHFSLMSLIWPLFILLPGLAMLWPAYRSTAEDVSIWSWLAVPGSLLTLIGMLLVATNFGHGEIWAYGWTLFPAAIVAGVMLMQRHDPANGIHVSGRKIIRASLIVFMALGLVFELLIFSSLGPWWPLLLVLWGVFIIIRKRS